VNTDIYFYVYCSIGPEAIAYHSAVGISSWLFELYRLSSLLSEQQHTTGRALLALESESESVVFVVCHVSRYITPNCISEDQLTLKWKSRTHKCQ
jgi:hypothetical protein